MIDYYRQRTPIPHALPSVSYCKTYQLPEGSQVTVALRICHKHKKAWMLIQHSRCMQNPGLHKNMNRFIERSLIRVCLP